MKKMFLFLAVASSSFFVSCSSDDEPTPAPVATSIVLTSNVATIDLGQSVTLTVMNDLTQNVTATSTFTANDAAISGATFTPTAAGTYAVKATNGSLVSNIVTITVNEVPAMNSIFFDEENNAVNQSAAVYWGDVDTDADGTDDHSYWSMIVFVGADITFANPASSDQYIDVEFLTPIGLLPTTTNVVYLDVYELHLNGSEVVINSQEDGSITLSENLTNDLTETAFVSTADLNGTSSLELNYDGSFLGLYDGSGKHAQPKGLKNLKVASKAEFLKDKAKFFSSLKK